MRISVSYAPILALICGMPLPVQASQSSTYVDVGGGISMIRGAEPFLGPTAPSSLGTGTAFGVGLGWIPKAGASLPIHLGLNYLTENASTSSGKYSVQAAYPTLGIQWRSFSVAAGYSPFVWRDTSSSGLSFLSTRAAGSTGLLYLAGYELSITPEFSFALSAGMQRISTAGVASPNPVTDFILSFRFYGGGSSNTYTKPQDRQKSQRGDGKYEGYRYPFGLEKN